MPVCKDVQDRQDKASAAKRSLGAILFADVAGYSKLMSENEQAAQTAVRAVLDTFEVHCQSHDGTIQQVRGDGVFAMFASSVNALRAAMEAQQELKTLNARADMKVELRVGINLGEVMHDETGIFGDSINVAARLEGLADPGGVCISSAVYEQVKNRLNYGYEPIGLQTLKNISEPIEVFKVVHDVATATRSASLRPISHSERKQISQKPSVAVLPFSNLSGDPSDSWFSEGLTQDITSNLSKFHNLFVISRNSAFVYQGRQITARQVASELGVRYIVHGNVRKAGDRVRVSVDLADALQDQMVWGEHYDRTLEDIFEVQDEVTSMVVAGTAVQIDAAERRLALSTPPNLLEAYSLSLRGQQHIYRYRRDDNETARKLYTEANRIDEKYARATAGISRSLNVGWRYSWLDDQENPLDKALEYAQIAVGLDQTDARGHGELGFAHLYRKEHEASINAYQRAVSLNPNDADLLSELADAYGHSGRNEDAIDLFKRAMQLNPFYPDQYLWYLGGVYYNMRDYDHAIATIMQMHNPAEGQRLLAASYAQLGNMKMARQHADILLQVHPQFSIEKWAGILPDKDSEDAAHFIEGLKKAGL
jgi:TolB-like protein/class 3 adenylate cyclase